jgi:hypothetical protein
VFLAIISNLMLGRYFDSVADILLSGQESRYMKSIVSTAQPTNLQASQYILWTAAHRNRQGNRPSLSALVKMGIPAHSVYGVGLVDDDRIPLLFHCRQLDLGLISGHASSS